MERRRKVWAKRSVTKWLSLLYWCYGALGQTTPHALGLPFPFIFPQRPRSRLPLLDNCKTDYCLVFPTIPPQSSIIAVWRSSDAIPSCNSRLPWPVGLGGAIITTVDQIISELAVEWTSPLGQKLVGILNYH